MTELYYDLILELIKWQYHQREMGTKHIFIFEGYDGAGKTTSIRKITEHLNQRSCKTVSLSHTTETTTWWWAKYVNHFPERGEQTFWDRSYYTRCLVEKVMGYCNSEEVENFFHDVVRLERMWIQDGFQIKKFWFDIDKTTQETRIQNRQDDPLKRTKLSEIDLASVDRYWDYLYAKEVMLRTTGTRWCGWNVVDSTDKQTARITVLKHILKDSVYPNKNKFLFE